MKKTRFTEAQIFNILKEYDAGKNILDISRDHGVSKATVPCWPWIYGKLQKSFPQTHNRLQQQ